MRLIGYGMIARASGGRALASAVRSMGTDRTIRVQPS
jgi:hypothetical protein